MLESSFVEAIVVTDADSAARVSAWLSRRGIESRAMTAGLLATGPASAFDAAFGLDPTNGRPPLELPVPEALSDLVTSVTILGSPETH